jgi:hypothetical protein
MLQHTLHDKRHRRRREKGSSLDSSPKLGRCTCELPPIGDVDHIRPPGERHSANEANTIKETSHQRVHNGSSRSRVSSRQNGIHCDSQRNRRENHCLTSTESGLNAVENMKSIGIFSVSILSGTSMRQINAQH